MRLKSRQRDADMTQGVVWRQILEFAVPMTIGLIFQQFYNTVDTIVVGQFVGKEALAAVGSTGSIINMMVSLSSGLSTGATVVISQAYGSHDQLRLHNAVQTTMVITFLVGLFATFAGMALVTPMLHLMDTPEDVFASAKEYLTIYFAGMLGLMYYNMGSGILRAVGDSKRPLYFLIFSACTNIVLDLLFVIVFHLGVAGVAYATIASQFLSAILVVYVLSHPGVPYAVDWHSLRISGTELHSILSIGLPTSIQQTITSFSNVFVQSYINFFGSSCMAGWSAYNKLDSFVLVPMQAIAMASTTFVGQNFGARQYSRARHGVNVSLGLSEIITVFLGIIAIVFAPLLLRMFTQDEEVLAYGVTFIRTITPFYMFNCVNQMYAGALRGVGKATTPTLIMLFSFVGFRQLFLFTNKMLFANSFLGMSLAYPSGWVVCTTLMAIFYHRSLLFRSPEALAEKQALAQKS